MLFDWLKKYISIGRVEKPEDNMSDDENYVFVVSSTEVVIGIALVGIAIWAIVLQFI